MKMRRGCVILSAVLLLCSASLDLLGYGTTTHSVISWNAYDAATNIQANFFRALGLDPQTILGSKTARVWVVFGSQYEDDTPLPVTVAPPIVAQSGLLPYARVLFHFLDPYKNSGLTFGPLSQTTTSKQWAIFGTGQSFINIPLVGGQLSANNDFPYNRFAPIPGARNHFYNGLTMSDPGERGSELGLMFRSLGQVVHLLQDAAQPQHVRNDLHLDLGATPLAWFPVQTPSAYERYVDANAIFQPSSGVSPSVPFPIPDQSFKGTGAKVAFDYPEGFFETGLGTGIAEFTNRNFVSAGTNCTNAKPCASAGGYPSPDITAQSRGHLVDMLYGGNWSQCQAWFSAGVCESYITLFANQFLDPVSGGIIRNDRMTTFSMFDFDLMNIGQPPFFSLGSFNYQTQAQILIPKAVDYSAGLLNYFFRGSMTAQTALNGFTITNTSCNGALLGVFSCIGGVGGETMNGTFSLYYDDQSGNRHLVPGANNWSLSIAGGATSAPLAFVPPANPAPAQYILVFRGTLGAETNAVAGTVVTLKPKLTVQVQGNGTVSSSPAGIDCGQTCSAVFLPNAQVTLTATSNSDAKFDGWSGDCAGTATSVTVAMTGDKTCIATFAPGVDLLLIQSLTISYELAPTLECGTTIVTASLAPPPHPWTYVVYVDSSGSTDLTPLLTRGGQLQASFTANVTTQYPKASHCGGSPGASFLGSGGVILQVIKNGVFENGVHDTSGVSVGIPGFSFGGVDVDNSGRDITVILTPTGLQATGTRFLPNGDIYETFTFDMTWAKVRVTY